jgi:hypothetical protein
MSWAVGYDRTWHRDIGYGVPAFCDHPKCNAEIDRGLSYVCGAEPYGGEHGCGLYFCSVHLGYYTGNRSQVCPRCGRYRKPYRAKPDHPRWIEHKLTDESWQRWRDENPSDVLALRQALHAIGKPVDARQAIGSASPPLSSSTRSGEGVAPIMVDRDADLRREMRAYLDTLTITGDTIGDIRRSLFVPWDSAWNGWVRDDTAEREKRPVREGVEIEPPETKENDHAR